MSAKQLNRCDVVWREQARDTATVSVLPAHRLSALDMRYVVRANVARSKGNFFGRMFRWNYFDISRDSSEALWGMFDTRFNARFDGMTESLTKATEQRTRLEAFGEMLSYLQDATTPARVVPVFTGRWWAFSMQDRFDRYPVDTNRLESSGLALCADVAEQLEQLQSLATPKARRSLLAATAYQTMAAVDGEILGMPSRWSAFWQPSLKDPGADFGDYGIAGNNFGNRVTFRCPIEADPNMRCLLLKDDPLYQEFAYERHRQAVSSTMLAMLLVQGLTQT
ncbi:MAG: hypothetical protein GWP70_13200 [Proteobacteria bacterium]|nr:hypothetical protein [Pseudomonadota bacterium]